MEELEALRRRVHDLERATAELHDRHHRHQQARLHERAWIEHLRREVHRLHVARGVVGRRDDTPELVLRAALALLEGSRGALLGIGRRGGLEVHAAVGFDGDPRETAGLTPLALAALERDVAERGAGLVAIPVRTAHGFDGVLVCGGRAGGYEDLDEHLLLVLGDHAGGIMHDARVYGDLREAFHDTVAVLAAAIEAKDRRTGHTPEEISHYVLETAERLGVDEPRRELLAFGALLHDVGKLAVPDAILAKPGPLTAEERAAVERHPQVGARLVESVPALEPLAPALRHHHERYDGDGYPDRLEGERIPLEARIIGVGDSFGAMTADRPYRPGMSTDEACAELERCAGTQFDPRVVRAFVDRVRGQVTA